MFAVPKYAAALESLRKERNVEGLFNHNLVKVDGKSKKATFAKADGTTVEESYDLLHVTPPQCPPDFIKNSPLGSSLALFLPLELEQKLNSDLIQ